VHLAALLDHVVVDDFLRFLLEARSVGGAVGLLFCNVKTLYSPKLIPFHMLQLCLGVSKHSHVLLTRMFADFGTILNRVSDDSLPVLICLRKQLSCRLKVFDLNFKQGLESAQQELKLV